MPSSSLTTEITDLSDARAAPRRSWAVLVAIGLTLFACGSALVFRSEVRSRYWAWCLARTTSITERALYLGAICNAGESGRWGIAALLAEDRGDVRQYGVLALQALKSPWARARLQELGTDADPQVQHLAAIGLSLQSDKVGDSSGGAATRPAAP